MIQFRKTLIRILIGLIAAVFLIFTIYLWDMKHAYKRIRGRSKVITSPYGNIEYTEGGSGTPVLVIHGSGYTYKPA